MTATPSRRQMLIATTGLLPGLTGCLETPPEDGADAPPPITERRVITQLARDAQTAVSFGGYVNGESFQQDGILSFNGYQYAAYWNTAGQVVAVRRPAGDGPWSYVAAAPNYQGNVNDAHSTISMGISASDGRLHLAFDHHSSDLHYVRSIPDLVTQPKSMAWASASFEPVTSLLGTEAVTLVTYPRFIPGPGGRLLLSYRHGASGSGDEVLWDYDGAAATWTKIGTYIAGIADGVNAYLHGIEYEGRRLHAAWCWRTTPDAATNHDLLYAYSDDDGRTWCNGAGAPVATTGTAAMSPHSDIVAWTIGANRGLINQEHMIVDHAGRVHVLLSHLPDAQPADANFGRARANSEFFHYWRDVDGRWTREPLNLAVTGTWRGKLAVSAANNLYAVLPNLRLASASAVTRWSNWTLIDVALDGVYYSDPLIDRQQLRSSDRLTVFAPTAPIDGVVYIDTISVTLY